MIDLRFGLRVTAGVAIVMLAGLAANQPAAGAAAATGALCVGFASMQGVYRSRAAAMLWTALAMGISTCVGGICAWSLPALTIVSALWGFGYGLIASLGPAATVVGVNAVIALVVFGHLQFDLQTVFEEALLVFCGGLVQTVLLVSIWPLRRFSVERHALARASRALAAYARAMPRGEVDIPAAAPMMSVRAALSDPQPFARRGEIGAFQALLDESVRIRSTLAAFSTDRARSTDPAPIDAFALASAEILDALANALDAGRAPTDDGAWKQFEEAETALENARSTDAPLRSEAQALAGQLRAAWRIAQFPGEDVKPEPGGIAPPAPTWPRFGDTFATLRANLRWRSVYGRLAIRLAATLAVATLLGGILPTKHGYWIAMTAAILLKPDFTTTLVRGIGRIGGTLIGAVLATALAAYVRPGPETYVALCIGFAAIAGTIVSANYALFTVAVTTYVVFALALVGQPEAGAVTDRVFGTLCAAVLAAVALLALPTWEARRVRPALALLLEANTLYVRLILTAYTDPKVYDPAAISEAQLTAWTTRAAAEASIDRMIGEPRRTHQIESARALGLLAASRRIALASSSLIEHFANAAPQPHPSLAPLAAALEGSLQRSIDALRNEREDVPAHGLRDIYHAFKNEASIAGGGDLAMLLYETDALVDAVNTVAELVAGEVREPV